MRSVVTFIAVMFVLLVVLVICLVHILPGKVKKAANKKSSICEYVDTLVRVSIGILVNKCKKQSKP